MGRSNRFFLKGIVGTLYYTSSLLLIRSRVRQSIGFRKGSSLQVISLREKGSRVHGSGVGSSGFFYGLVGYARILRASAWGVFSRSLVYRALSYLHELFQIGVYYVSVSLAFRAFRRYFHVSAVSRYHIRSYLTQLGLRRVGSFVCRSKGIRSNQDISFLSCVHSYVLMFLQLWLFVFFLRFLQMFSFMSRAALIQYL